MPNWCENTLAIMGSKEDINHLKEFVKDDQSILTFESILPCPVELRHTTAPNRNEQKAGYLLKKYGASDWYNWCVNNWDTKWDACEVALDETDYQEEGVYLEYRFETAWSPPIKVIDELAKKYPTLKLHLSFDESGMGFSGWRFYKDGQLNTMEDYDQSYYSLRSHMEPTVDLFEYL